MLNIKTVLIALMLGSFAQLGLAQVGFVKLPSPKLEWAGDCEDGLCLVKINGSWGYCDTTGKLVIPAEFTSAQRFGNGYARVTKDGKEFYIDKQGAPKPSDKYGAVSPYGPDLYTYVGSDGMTGFLDKNYTEKGSLKCKQLMRTYASEGTAMAINEKMLYGYINYKAELAIPFEYTNANEFHNGLAIVSKKEANADKYGIINTKNEAVVPFEYQRIYQAGKHYLLVKNNTITVYDVAAGKTDDKPAKIFYADYLKCIGNFVIAKNAEGKKTLFDEHLEPVSALEWDDVWISSAEKVILKIRVNGKYGYADAKGHIIAPCEYDDAGFFYNGIARVSKKGAYGYINDEGKMIIPFQFTDGNPISCGATSVKYKGEWILIRAKRRDELKKEEALIAQKKLPDADACLKAVLEETHYVEPGATAGTTSSKPFHFTAKPEGPCAPALFDDEALPLALKIEKKIEATTSVPSITHETGSGDIATTFFTPQTPGDIFIVVFTTGPCNNMEVWDVSGYNTLSKNIFKGKPNDGNAALMNTDIIKSLKAAGFYVYLLKIKNSTVIEGKSLRYRVQVSGDGKYKANGISLIWVLTSK